MAIVRTLGEGEQRFIVENPEFLYAGSAEECGDSVFGSSEG